MAEHLRLTSVHVDRVNRFSLDIDELTGRTFFSIPVRNQMVEYSEFYEIPRATFDRFVADPSLALAFVELARKRLLDALLLFPPGSDRGEP